jgi:outer membrane protein insertion porin family
MHFHIAPGSRVYVRHIKFKGNTMTADYVLRRAMQQTEGGRLSLRKVRESVRQLRLLGFFKQVDVETKPVPGSNNQVDVIYDVKEARTGQASLSLGYGTLGFNIGASIDQPNFLGTGRLVSIGFNRSSYSTTYNISYYNPYYTINNIGRGFSAYYTHTRPARLNLTSSYDTDTYGLSNFYNIPLTLNGSLQAKIALNHIRLKLSGCNSVGSYGRGCVPVSRQVRVFVDKRGHTFTLGKANLSYNYNAQDRAIFPTSGLSSSLTATASLPVFKNRLEYYKLSAQGKYYYPLTHSRRFVLKLRAGAGFGGGYGSDGMLPFLFNYHAGGLAPGGALVRGYTTNTLGPRDSNDQPLGGNVQVFYGASLIFPNYISPSTVRTLLFVDAGNTYQTKKHIYGTTNLYNRGAGPIRYAAGLAMKWRSPIGPISLSYAKPINAKKYDEKEYFQFTMGTNF